MFEINDIVFHQAYGFGVITKMDSVSAVIFFSSGQQKKIIIDHPSLILVNKELINTIINNDVRNYFDDWTIQKAGGYEQSISSYSYKDNQISANIYGNDTYETSIKINSNRNLSFSCNCPVQGKCKHEVALYSGIKKMFSNLSRGTKTIDKELIRTLLVIKNGSITFENVTTACNKILSKLSLELLQEVIDTINPGPHSYSYSYNNEKKRSVEFVNYLMLNDEIRNVFKENVQNFSSFNLYKTIINAIKQAGDLKYSYGNYNIVKYLFANEDYKECIIKSLDYYNYSYNFSDYVYEACKRVTINDDFITVFKANLRKNINERLYEPLINKLPFDDVFELVKDGRFSIEYRNISDYTLEQKQKILPYAMFDADDINDLFKEDYINQLDDRSKATIITSFDKEDLGPADKRKLTNVAKKIENSKYLIEYLKGETYSRNRYYWYSNGIFPIIKNEKYEINDKEFFAYFKEDYKVEREEDDVLLCCYLKKLNNDVLIDVSLNNDGYELKENGFDGKEESIYIRYLIDYITKKYEKEITKEREQILKEIKKEKDKEKSDIALSYLRGLTYSNTNTTRLIENKAHLEYYFDFDRDNDFSLSLKVGINKTYVIKDVYQFLDNFRKCNNEEYGKNFTLTHDLDNFIDRDKTIIQELLKQKLFSYNRKEFAITSNMIDYIFDKLKGNNIYIRKKPYTLRLESKNINFNIDKEYRIQQVDNLDVDNYLITDNNIYLLNDKQQYIDCVYSTYKDVKIISFLLENRDTIVKPLLNEFKDIVYYDHRDRISIDESIQKDFTITDVGIKAYFDYEDSLIKCRSEYYIDDKKIDVDKIKEKYNITKINKYHNYLKDLGFEENVLANDGKILNFFSMDFSELKKYCEVYLSDSIQNKKLSYFSPAKIQIKCESNVMQAFVEESEYSDEELYKILAAIKKKKKFIIMNNDHIIDLTNRDADEFANTVDELGLDKKNLTNSVELPIAKALKAIAHQNSCNIDDYLLNMINDISNFKKADIKLPKINATLREYQKEGFNWLSILSKYHIGGILADDMGLGKTIEMITLISSDNNKKPNLIVCPKSVVFNWVNEFNRFSPDEKVVEIYGLKKQREEIIKNIKQKEKVTYVVSYDSLRNDIDMYKATFNYVVLDEAQYIKNVNAQKTHNVKKIKAEHKFALTGTPIENNIVDLWSVFDFVIPGYFEGIDEFKSRYNNDENYTHIISKRVAPFILRRNKKDVLKDLPDKYEHILSAEMSEAQRKVYDAYVLQAKDKLSSGYTAFQIFPYLMRLRQICIDPKIFIENYEGDSGKMTLLKQLIVDYINSDHRMMIVSQFVQALNEIEQMLKELNIPYFIITGSVDAKKRMEICDKFNNNSYEKIVLVSLKAGGTGINLIGADTVIHLDPWWNVAATDQATDRTYRIGQIKNVEVIKLICEKSIEQRVIELQNIKKDLIDKVISDNDSSVENASIDDIKFILD